MSPAPQSLLKFASLQLADFNIFALSLSEPLINVTISATLSEPPPTFVLWCLPTCDAFRDLSQLPFLHQSLLEFEKHVLDIIPCSTPSPSVYCKKKKKKSPAPFVVGISTALTQHRAHDRGRYLSEGTAWVCNVFQGKLHCSVCTDTSSAHFTACSAGTQKL